MSGSNPNNEELQQQQQQQARLLHALSQSDAATMEGFMNGTFSSFGQPMNIAGMMQGIARQNLAGAGRGSNPMGGNGRGSLNMSGMNLAPFNASNFSAANAANSNFLAFISPNGGRGGNLNVNRPGVSGASGRTPLPNIPTQPNSSSSPSAGSANLSFIGNQARGDDSKNPTKRRKPTVVSGEGGLLLLPRSEDQSPSLEDGNSNSMGNFSSLSNNQHGGNASGNNGSNTSSNANGGREGGNGGVPRRKHRAKTNMATELAFNSKSAELAEYFKSNLPQHTNTNTATLAHWLKAIRESESMQEANKDLDIPSGSLFTKVSTSAELLSRATKRQEACTPDQVASSAQPTNDAQNEADNQSRFRNFSQNYDEGISLFDDQNTAGAVSLTSERERDEMKSPENTLSTTPQQFNVGEGDKSMTSDDVTGAPSSMKDTWLPNLLLIMAHMGFDRCFRDISQCVAMLRIDINAPAPIPLKDKDNDKTNGLHTSGSAPVKSMVAVPVSTLSSEVSAFLTRTSTLMKRNILLAMISNEGQTSSTSSNKASSMNEKTSSMLSFEMMRGDDSILHAAWNAVLADKEFKQGLEKMRKLSLATKAPNVNMILTNPFGAHGFDADTCDRWTFPSLSNQSGAIGGVPTSSDLPLKKLVASSSSTSRDQVMSVNAAYLESSSYKQLCKNYDSKLSSLVLSFPSTASKQQLRGSGGVLQTGDMSTHTPTNFDEHAAMINTVVLLGEHASQNLGEFGPCMIATTYDKCNKWLELLEKHAPQLKVLPYWGCCRDRVSMHGFIDSYETGCQDSSWHVLLAPVDALLAEVIPQCKITCWQLLVIDELQPLLMSSTLTVQRAALLRVRTCHGRLILQNSLAPNKGKEMEMVGAVTSWSLDTLCGLACTLNPEHHAVIRRVVGRAISDKSTCHASLEGHILPLLLSLLQPSVVAVVHQDRDLSSEFTKNKVSEWRDMTAHAVSLSLQALTKSIKEVSPTSEVNPEDEKVVRQNITAVCLSFEEFGSNSSFHSDPIMDSSHMSSMASRNHGMWFDSLCKIIPNRLVPTVKLWDVSSAPSATYPANMIGYDDDFVHFFGAPMNMTNPSTLLPSSSVSSMLNNSSLAPMSDMLSMNIGGGNENTLVRTSEYLNEFMSPWQAPQEMEEDAEDELAGDVYPYGDYLYGTAESSARGIGVGGAGGVVLDLSGVPELIPPMPRQRTSGPATSSRYRGVCRSKRTATDKWQAQISYGGTNYYLGLFDSEAEAGVAYARAHYKFYGAGSVGMSSYAVGSGKSAPGGGSSGKANNTQGGTSNDSLDKSDANQASNSSHSSTEHTAANDEDLQSMVSEVSEADSRTFRLVCSSSVAKAVKQDMLALKQQEKEANQVEEAIIISHFNMTEGGVSSLKWNDELDKKYWVMSEENEGGHHSTASSRGSNASGRPGTPTKGADKEKKRKGSKISIDDSTTEIGLQSMVYFANDQEGGSDWPFDGALASSSSFSQNNTSGGLITHPGMADASSNNINGTPKAQNTDNLLSLELKGGSWPTLAPATSTSSDHLAKNKFQNMTSSGGETVPPMVFAMSMLRPLIQLQKQEAAKHELTPKHILILEGKEALDASLANSTTLESKDMGYAKLIGFVVSSKSNANLVGFHTTISKSSISVGNAAHEVSGQGRAGISAWSRAMSNVCGTSVAASATLLTAGAAVGDMDIHLGDNIEPGINAHIMWVEAKDIKQGNNGDNGITAANLPMSDSPVDERNQEEDRMRDEDKEAEPAGASEAIPSNTGSEAVDANANAATPTDASTAVTAASPKGCFYLQACSMGVAVEGKAVPKGTRVALSSGSVISFGANSVSDNVLSHQPKIITQFLLPVDGAQGNVSSMEKAKTDRSAEKLMLAALRLATQDTDLRKYIPNLLTAST